VSPKVLAILAVIVIVIVAGMALTMKRAAEKRRDRTAMSQDWAPAFAGATDHSIRRCFIA
jgi:hypothetical protein